MPTNAKYKIWDQSLNSGAGGWVEYHFETNAGQVLQTNVKHFVTSNTTVNNQPFVLTNPDTEHPTRTPSENVTITGAHIANGVTGTHNRITNGENINVSLATLADAIPTGTVLTTGTGGNFSTNFPDLNAIEGLSGTSGLLKKTAANTWALDTNSYVVANSAITSATKCKITYDSKGLVTAGADLQASDIPDLSATYLPISGGISNPLQGILYAPSGIKFVASQEASLLTDDSGTLKYGGDVLATQDYVKDGILTIQAEGTTKGTFSANASSNTTINLTASDFNLTGALVFIGTSTTDPTSTSGATVSGHTTWKKGDVVLYNSLEYVNTTGTNTSSTTPNPNWEELGNGASYALKTTTISAGTGLTGGGDLTQNRTLSLADAYGDTKNPYGTKTKNYVLAGPDGSSGHTADAVPTFRALVANDIPDLGSTYLKRAGGSTNAMTGDLYLGGHILYVGTNSYIGKLAGSGTETLTFSSLGDEYMFGNNVLDFSSASSNTFDFPNADGTIALQGWVTTQLGAYLPLAGNNASTSPITGNIYLDDGLAISASGSLLIESTVGGEDISIMCADGGIHVQSETGSGCYGAILKTGLITNTDKTYNFPDDTPASGSSSLTLATQEWVGTNYSRITVATSAPSSPSTGDIWVDTSTSA